MNKLKRSNVTKSQPKKKSTHTLSHNLLHIKAGSFIDEGCDLGDYDLVSPVMAAGPLLCSLLLVLKLDAKVTFYHGN